MRSRPTMRDVAQRASVSVATVSRVINGGDGITEPTAERVRAAVRELGFRPNVLGRSLKTARSHTLGIMIPALSNPVFADLISGIEAAAQTRGYTVLLAASNYALSREEPAIATLLSHRVEGLVLTVADADDSGTLDALDSEGVPYVLVYNQPFRARRSAVTVDNVKAGREVVEALAGCGHQRIGMVAGRFDASDRSRARYRGFEEAAQEYGINPRPVIEVDFSDPHLSDALCDVFLGADRPTALFCSNDLLAIATIGALRQLGLYVPDDVSVVGFDGIAVGKLIEPTLATIEQPSRLIGETAAERLLGRLSGGANAETAVLPHRFRPGGSMGPAPGHGPGAGPQAGEPHQG